MQISLFFGTQTGNTEIMAQELGVYMQQWANTIVIPFETVNQIHIDTSTIIICGTSSWGDGTPNNDTERFISRIGKLQWPAHIPVYIFCMGDRAYGEEYFCGAAQILAQALTQKNAPVQKPYLYIDGYPEGENLIHAYEWSAALSRAPLQ